MKRKIWFYGITLLVAVIGMVLYFYKFDSTLATVIDNHSVTVFQLGVFKNKDDAINFTNNNIGYIFYDGTYYRVYGALTVTNIDLNEAYFESINVNYYKKKVSVNKNFYNLVKEYDSLTNNIDNIPATNKDLMESYLENIN